MVGWHHQLNGHKFEQTPGDGEGQGSLVCCQSMGLQRVRHDWVNKQQSIHCLMGRNPGKWVNLTMFTVDSPFFPFWDRFKSHYHGDRDLILFTVSFSVLKLPSGTDVHQLFLSKCKQKRCFISPKSGRILRLHVNHLYIHIYPLIFIFFFQIGHYRVLSRVPGEGNGTPLQYSCLENPMDWGAW